MSEKRDYSLCIDCKYQDGTWVSDREVDTWCTIKSGIDCDETFECDDYEAEVVDDEVEMLEKINEQEAIINKLQEENASLKQRIRDIKYNNCGD